MIKLVKPDIAFKTQYMEMYNAWGPPEEERHPWVVDEDPQDFKTFVARINGYSVKGPEGFDVPSTTLWAYDEARDKLVGVVNIRHHINFPSLSLYGGHVGYGVREDERRKGYATAILSETLKECKKLGLDRILISCDRDNVGSRRTIEKNGGIFDREVEVDGSPVMRFYIYIK
jgi:predicted acetyltransferase